MGKSSSPTRSRHLRIPRWFHKKGGKKGIPSDMQSDEFTVYRLEISGLSDEFTVDRLEISGQSGVTPTMQATHAPKVQEAEESTNCMCPIMARLDALQIQQQLQGMNHPDVLFALRHLARAHRRRGEIELSDRIEEMIHCQEIGQGQENLFSI